MTGKFKFTKRESMPLEVVAQAKKQWPNLQNINNGTLLKMADGCINEIENLHNAIEITENPPEDIDVIWDISAPGWLMKKGSMPGWSSNYPELDNCEKEVVERTINLTLVITAKRLGKLVHEVTKEDVLNHGPLITYNGPPLESADFTQFLKRPNSKIPLQKAYIFDKISRRGIVNTFDQAKSIHMPPNVHPRKIAISVLAAQWVRLGRLLAKAKTLRKGIPIILVPTPSPRGFEREHAIMESKGALINTFEHHRSSAKPILYVS